MRAASDGRLINYLFLFIAFLRYAITDSFREEKNKTKSQID